MIRSGTFALSANVEQLGIGFYQLLHTNATHDPNWKPKGNLAPIEDPNSIAPLPIRPPSAAQEIDADLVFTGVNCTPVVVHHASRDKRVKELEDAIDFNENELPLKVKQPPRHLMGVKTQIVLFKRLLSQFHLISMRLVVSIMHFPPVNCASLVPIVVDQVATYQTRNEFRTFAMFLPTIWSNPFFSFYSQYDVHCMWKFVHDYNYENWNNLYFNEELSLDHVIVSKFDYITRTAKKNHFLNLIITSITMLNNR